VLGGIPLHQDLVLTDAEHESNRVMTPCCSRSQSPELVLDL
jgi:vanillate O-demethylase ferredoxin subunit